MSPIGSFADALRAFPTARAAGQWMGIAKNTVAAMILNDWVPEKHWPQFLAGLAGECGVTLHTKDLEGWAIARGRWTRTPQAPRDWSDLPRIERRIYAVLRSKRVDPDMARDAASHALLQMMEAGQSHVGYGMRCAFNWISDQRAERLRWDYLTTDEANSAMTPTTVTMPAQEHYVALARVIDAAKTLPQLQREVFVMSCVYGYEDQVIADTLNLSPETVHSYRRNVRRALRAHDPRCLPEEVIE